MRAKKEHPVELQIGDKVRFFNELEDVWLEDTIRYFDENVIEGTTYDLTYVNFEIIN